MNQIRKCFLDMTAQFKDLGPTSPDMGRSGYKKGPKIKLQSYEEASPPLQELVQETSQVLGQF